MNFKISPDGLTAMISGKCGPFGKKVDEGIPYGRNAISNFQEYLKDLTSIKTTDVFQKIANLSEDLLNPNNSSIDDALDLILNDITGFNNKTMTPIDFEVRYMPENKFDPMALMGAAFEDMKKKFKIPLNQANEHISPEYTLEAFSNNGEIGLAENAAAILIEDMSSGLTPEEVARIGRLDLDASNIRGSFNQNGTTNIKFFQKSEEALNTKDIVNSIIDYFKLKEEAEKAEKMLQKEYIA